MPLPAEQTRAPSQPGAEAEHHDDLPGSNASVFQRFRESNRDTRSGRVAETIQVSRPTLWLDYRNIGSFAFPFNNLPARAGELEHVGEPEHRNT